MVNQQLQDISMKLRKRTRFETASYQIKTIPKTVRSQEVIPLQKPTKGLLLKHPEAERYGFVGKGVNGGGIAYSNFR